MKIKLSKRQVVEEDQEVDVVTALRARAAEHVKSHLEKSPRKGKSDPYVYNPPDQPIDLWTAKLLLEIADLFQRTDE